MSDVLNVVSGTGERRVQQGRLDPPIRGTQPRAAAGAKRRLHSGRERGDAELEPLPIILGAELPGIVEAIGSEVLGFNVGDEVYGATNAITFLHCLCNRRHDRDQDENAKRPLLRTGKSSLPLRS